MAALSADSRTVLPNEHASLLPRAVIDGDYARSGRDSAFIADGRGARYKVNCTKKRSNAHCRAPGAVRIISKLRETRTFAPTARGAADE